MVGAINPNEGTEELRTASAMAVVDLPKRFAKRLIISLPKNRLS
jgi:hypothetical protein